MSAAAGAMVDAGAASVAQEIGRAYRNGAGDMSWLTHKVCHFVLGGGSAALKGEDPLSGAVGATIGEVVADAMIARALEQTRADVLEQLEDFRANYGTLPPIQDAELLTQITFQERLLYERERIEQVGRLAAAGTAFVGRMDVSTADAAALNALEHNVIPSIDVLIENQHRSLLDQLLAYEQASIEQGVVESQADREAAVFFEPAITFLCPPLELAALGIRHYALGEVIPASELAIAGLNILPIGKGCAIVSKGATKVVARVGFIRKVLSESEIVIKVEELQGLSKRWRKLEKDKAKEAFSHIGLCGTYEELIPFTKGFKGAIQAHHYALPAELCRKFGIPSNKAACVILPDIWHYKTASFGTKIFDRNLRSVTAQGTLEVRHILQTEGIYNSGVNRGLAEDISNFINGHPELYGKK